MKYNSIKMKALFIFCAEPTCQPHSAIRYTDMRILCLGAALVSERIIPDETSALPVSKILEVGIAVCERAV